MRTRRARRLEDQPLEHNILRLRLVTAHHSQVVRHVPDRGFQATTIAGGWAAVVRAQPRGKADVISAGQAVAVLLFRSDG
jgi:hypothetical protein